ncbi:hypothetical protein D3260_08495 [Salinisphaera sp. Q1T1-3]|nr:hypothetical protein D3260_08495 [Salinisphaera sp. Q1T1-3]
MMAGAATLALLGGCAAQKPVLYAPNDAHPPGGEAAVEACQNQARAAGLDYSKGRVGATARGAVKDGAVGGAGGAVAGAIYGNAARGAAAGAAGGVAAGLVRGLFAGHDSGPAPAYKAYVNRCLRSRGYDPVGWN